MKRFFFLLIGFLASSGLLFAQANVQWASKLIAFSSNSTNQANTAIRVLGPPNCMPQGGQNGNAWEPKDKKNQFITVGFEKPTAIERILVLENYMPGSITKVTAYDTQGGEHVLFENKTPKPPLETSRTFMVNTPRTAYSVAQVRVDLNPLIPEDDPQIDAIGIMEKAGPVSFIRLQPDIVLKERPQRLSADINTTYPEDAPFVTYDGQTLYFSRGLHPQNAGGVTDIEDIWLCKMQPDTTWGKPFNLGPPLNNKSANFIFSETKDGRTLLLGNVYGSKGQMKAGASVVHRKADGTFSDPQSLNIKNDYNLNPQVDYFLNSDGKVLIISEERRDAVGERDLYVSLLQPDSTWSEPVNLGANVNTAVDEFAPFLAPDNRSLFFSTAGWPGYGDVDIFVCFRIGDGWTQWSEPYNLGNLVNGPNRDSYFSLPARGKYAYFTADNQNSTETDIYRIRYPRSLAALPEFTTPTVDSATAKKTTPLVREFANKTPDPEAKPVEGEAAIKEKEAAEAKAQIAAKEAKAAQEAKEEAEAKAAAPKDQKGSGMATFNPVYFGFNKSDLGDVASLEAVAQYLKENPRQTVTLEGHADSVGSEAYNKKLALQRARNTAKWLRQHGVASSRVRAISFGENNPVSDNDTEDGRAKNRRVQITLFGGKK